MNLAKRIEGVVAAIMRIVLRKALPVGSVSNAGVSGNRPLYLFFDEAGNLDFGPKGTAFFVCGILATYDPWPIMNVLGELRERIFRGGFIPQAFHAAEDRQAVRDQVFEAIRDWGQFEMHAMVLEKWAAPTTYREQARFYAFAADLTLRMVLQRYPTDEPIYVITDSLPLNKKREAVIKGFKTSLSAVLPGRQFIIEHHPSGAQGCLQVADYLTWAVYRKWEIADRRSYDAIGEFLAEERRLDWSLIHEK